MHVGTHDSGGTLVFNVTDDAAKSIAQQCASLFSFFGLELYQVRTALSELFIQTLIDWLLAAKC